MTNAIILEKGHYIIGDIENISPNTIHHTFFKQATRFIPLNHCTFLSQFNLFIIQTDNGYYISSKPHIIQIKNNFIAIQKKEPKYANLYLSEPCSVQLNHITGRIKFINSKQNTLFSIIKKSFLNNIF